MLIHFLCSFGLQKWQTNIFYTYRVHSQGKGKLYNWCSEVLIEEDVRLFVLLALKEQGRNEADAFIAAVKEPSLFCTECQYKLIYDVPNFNKDKLWLFASCFGIRQIKDLRTCCYRTVTNVGVLCFYVPCGVFFLPKERLVTVLLWWKNYNCNCVLFVWYVSSLPWPYLDINVNCIFISFSIC